MNRRRFLNGSAAAATALGTSLVNGPIHAADANGPKKALMKAGNQHRSTDADLRVLAALGIRHICSALPSRALDRNWSIEELVKLRERVESFGIKLDMVPLPLSNAPTARAEFPNILLGKAPERDQDIKQICQMIRNAAKAGIPAVKYNLTVLGVVRTEKTPGRGGARYSTFIYDRAKKDGLTEAGEISEKEMWDRIGYFLKQVVSVAEECKVRLCCHPNDPGLPRGKAFRGVHCVLDSVEGLKRFVDIEPSPYHGLNFCQGTIAEMLEKPREQIGDVIRYFGKRGKIFNVHFRNIKGGLLNFQESFPDDGDVDMIQAMRIYKEVGFDGMIMPDHVPEIEGDARGAQAFAFAFGYIQALIQMVQSEG
jgi:mannonate dehydratase